MSKLQRTSLTIESDLLEWLDRFVRRSGHSNRSEAIRSLIRERMEGEARGSELATAVLAITFDHDRRELSDRLLRIAHQQRDMVLATTHLHIDHHRCLEMSALHGPREQLQRYADNLIAMKGVYNGSLMLLRSQDPHRQPYYRKSGDD